MNKIVFFAKRCTLKKLLCNNTEIELFEQVDIELFCLGLLFFCYFFFKLTGWVLKQSRKSSVLAEAQTNMVKEFWAENSEEG